MRSIIPLGSLPSPMEHQASSIEALCQKKETLIMYNQKKLGQSRELLTEDKHAVKLAEVARFQGDQE
jgi:hypothetical protein